MGGRRQTILTGGMAEALLRGGGKTNLGPEEEREPGYWSKEKFEERFVRNTLNEVGLRERGAKWLGHDPATLEDLWKVVKIEVTRPQSEAHEDLMEDIEEKVRAFNAAFGLGKKKK